MVKTWEGAAMLGRSGISSRGVEGCWPPPIPSQQRCEVIVLVIGNAGRLGKQFAGRDDRFRRCRRIIVILTALGPRKVLVRHRADSLIYMR
jgi:hypothetical protein